MGPDTAAFDAAERIGPGDFHLTDIVFADLV